MSRTSAQANSICDSCHLGGVVLDILAKLSLSLDHGFSKLAVCPGCSFVVISKYGAGLRTMEARGKQQEMVPHLRLCGRSEVHI